MEEARYLEVWAQSRGTGAPSTTFSVVVGKNLTLLGPS